jgi:hypothetical protein
MDPFLYFTKTVISFTNNPLESNKLYKVNSELMRLIGWYIKIRRTIELRYAENKQQIR